MSDFGGNSCSSCERCWGECVGWVGWWVRGRGGGWVVVGVSKKGNFSKVSEKKMAFLGGLGGSFLGPTARC